MPEGPQVKRTGNLLAECIGIPLIEVRIASKTKVLPITKPVMIKRVKVHGKNIFVYLDNGQVLYNHMLMWGKWGEGCEPQLGNKKLSVCFVFKTRSLGYYGGGVLKLITPEEANVIQAKLGPDIIQTKDETRAFERLKSASVPIGEALLAQELVAGIGNIYKSEGLFLAQINPERLTTEITPKEYKKLFTVLHAQMVKDITFPGIVTTTPELLERGYRRYVYKRYHQPCLVCEVKIERKYQGAKMSRSTYYCPNCQKD